MDIERASAESLLRFKAHFVTNYRRMSQVDQLPNLDCFTQSFPLMCVTSRRRKKPIMVMVMRDETEECATHALTSLIQAESVREMIEARFIFAGFTLEHPPIEQLANLISLGQQNHAALYFVVVSHDAKV